MTFERPFLSLAAPAVRFIASGASSLLAPSNGNRTQLKLQAADAFWVGVASGMPSAAGGIPGLLIASGVIIPDLAHAGEVHGFSAAANGATIAIRVWESSISG